MSLRSRPLNKVVQSFKRAVSVEKWEGVGNQISWSYRINTWQRSGCGKCGLPFKKFDKRMTAWSVLFWKKTPQCLWTKCKVLLERKGTHDRVNVLVGIHEHVIYSSFLLPCREHRVEVRHTDVGTKWPGFEYQFHYYSLGQINLYLDLPQRVIIRSKWINIFKACRTIPGIR